MNIRRHDGSALVELTGAITGLTLLSTLVVAAMGGVHQRTKVEASSARLEEAQNLLARWRRGETIAAPGWTMEQTTAADGSEIMTVRADGVHLATVRPHQASAP